LRKKAKKDIETERDKMKHTKKDSETAVERETLRKKNICRKGDTEKKRDWGRQMQYQDWIRKVWENRNKVLDRQASRKTI